MSKTNNPQSAAPTFDIPEGFEDISTADIEGWFVTEVGNSFAGKIVGRFSFVSEYGERPVVQVRLSAPSRAVDSEGDELTLEPGQVLGVGITHGCKQLQEYANGSEVFGVVTGTKDLGKGKKLYQYRLGAKGRRIPIAKPLPIPMPTASEDIPF